MRIALDNLSLDHLWIIYPGREAYPVDDKITVWPLQDVAYPADQLRPSQHGEWPVKEA